MYLMKPDLQNGSVWESLTRQGLKQSSTGRPGRGNSGRARELGKKAKVYILGSQQNERLRSEVTCRRLRSWTEGKPGGQDLPGGLGGSRSIAEKETDGWQN